MFLPLRESLPMSLLWDASMHIRASAIPPRSHNLRGEKDERESNTDFSKTFPPRSAGLAKWNSSELVDHDQILVFV